MSDGLPVDPLALCEEVEASYRVVAIELHGSYHFHTGRSLARRLGYEEAAGAALRMPRSRLLPVSATRSRSAS
jgi:hypothetical protein